LRRRAEQEGNRSLANSVYMVGRREAKPLVAGEHKENAQ
jgi:hypothetical protein